jgi:hypothetical protein
MALCKLSIDEYQSREGLEKAYVCTCDYSQIFWLSSEALRAYLHVYVPSIQEAWIEDVIVVKLIAIDFQIKSCSDTLERSIQ